MKDGRLLELVNTLMSKFFLATFLTPGTPGSTVRHYKNKKMKKIYILSLILLLIACNPTNKKDYIVNDNIRLYNVTHWKINNLIKFGISELNIYNPIVIVNYIPESILDDFKKSNADNLEGFVLETNLNNYQIFLNKNLSDIDVKRVVLHELIHIKQLSNGRLIVCNGNDAIFLNKEYNVNTIQYSNRLWEKEAVGMSNTLLSLLSYYNLKSDS